MCFALSSPSMHCTFLDCRVQSRHLLLLQVFVAVVSTRMHKHCPKHTMNCRLYCVTVTTLPQSSSFMSELHTHCPWCMLALRTELAHAQCFGLGHLALAGKPLSYDCHCPRETAIQGKKENGYLASLGGVFEKAYVLNYRCHGRHPHQGVTHPPVGVRCQHGLQ